MPVEEWERLLPFLSEKEFGRQEYLARAGEVLENFYFIESGLVRMFYATEDGKEFNKFFAKELEYFGSFHSLVLNQPCGFFLQALEHTNAIVLPNHAIRSLYDKHPCWERVGRKSAETDGDGEGSSRTRALTGPARSPVQPVSPGISWLGGKDSPISHCFVSGRDGCCCFPDKKKAENEPRLRQAYLSSIILRAFSEGKTNPVYRHGPESAYTERY